LKAGTASNWRQGTEVEVTAMLRSGLNIVAASARNDGSKRNPAGFIAALAIECSRGPPIVLVTDSRWRCSERALAGWKENRFNESGWVGAQELGPMEMKPWGPVSLPGERRLPARVLRREFALESKPSRATVSICGLGLFELYING